MMHQRIQFAPIPDGTSRVKIQADTYHGYYVEFEHECGTTLHARLLRDHLRKVISDAMEQARRRAYDQGYADGRGHKRRKTYFSPRLRGDE